MSWQKPTSTEPEAGTAEVDTDIRTLRWIAIAIAVLCLVALLAWARGEAGEDGRTPDPEDAAALVVGGH